MIYLISTFVVLFIIWFCRGTRLGQDCNGPIDVHWLKNESRLIDRNERPGSSEAATNSGSRAPVCLSDDDHFYVPPGFFDNLPTPEVKTHASTVASASGVSDQA